MAVVNWGGGSWWEKRRGHICLTIVNDDDEDCWQAGSGEARGGIDQLTSRCLPNAQVRRGVEISLMEMLMRVLMMMA